MPLNNSANAVSFLSLISTNAGRKALSADERDFSDARVKGALTNIHAAITTGLDVIGRLEKDETRTDPQKHARARQVAEQVNATITKSHQQMVAIAAEAHDEANGLINEYLTIDGINPFMLATKFQWLKDQWADGKGGAGRIREAIRSDRELAGIVYRCDAYLIGMPDAQRMDYVDTGIETHVPKAHELIDTKQAISKAADKLPDLANNISSSFYMKGIADKMASRVED